MEPEFITYQKFSDVALANAMAEQLDNHHIQYLIAEESFNFDPAFIMNNALTEYAVKIKSTDFEKATQALKDDESADVAEIDTDYYLFAFSNDELKEVITKADEWSSFDVVLARKLLTERGIIFSDKDLAAIKNERLEELREPDSSQTTWVIIGYIIALSGIIILPFFIAAIGLFIGWHLSSHKKTLPDGERVYAYNQSDRKHGKRIFYLGITVLVLNIIYFIYKTFIEKY
jgi:hypothetical protein